MKAPLLFILCFVLLSCNSMLYAEDRGTIIHLPAHKISPKSDSVPKVLWTRITNQSNQADTLYPLYTGRPDCEDKYRNDEALIKWLTSQVPDKILKSGDTNKIKLALIYASAPLTKSETKVSTVNFFNEGKCDNPDSAFARKYSIIGSQLGVYHDHCGDQVKFQQEILTATGYFKPSDFLTCVLGWHTTCAILYKGDTIAVDFASNKPFLLIKNPARISGFASPQDLHDDTLLITSDQSYYYLNYNNDIIHRNTKPGFLSEYRQMYAYKGPKLKNAQGLNIPLYKMENMWVLPPHASIEWADTFYYVIDSTRSATINTILDRALKKQVGYAEIMVRARNASYADSINYAVINAVQEILNTDFATAADVFLNDKLTLYSSIQGWRPIKAMTTPTLHVKIIADSSFIVFGKDAYCGPGFITMQHLKNQFTDTRLNYNLWANTIMSAPSVYSYKDVLYPVNSEVFAPPASILNLDISFNPAIIDFYGGASFRVSNPTALRIESSADAIVRQPVNSPKTEGQ